MTLNLIASKKTMRTSAKAVAAAVTLTLSLSTLAACGSSDSDGAATPKASASATPTAAKADVKGLPPVVAVVNGTEISKKDFVFSYENQFQQAEQQAQASGTPVDQDALKKKTADGLVSNKLLIAEAERRKFTATDAEVTTAIDGYAKQAGAADAAAYLKTLAAQGIDEAMVRSEVRSQLELDQLLADEAGDKKPTKAELQAIYDKAVAQQDPATAADPTKAIPPFKDVQKELKKEAKSQKESAAAEKLLASLRKTAKITINL